MKYDINTDLMFGLMMEKLCTKTATTNLRFFIMKMFTKTISRFVGFLVRVSSEEVQPVGHLYQSMFPIRLNCSFIGKKLW